MDVGNVRLRSPIKCKDRMLEYFRKMRDGELWRVHAFSVRRRPPIKM